MPITKQPNCSNYYNFPSKVSPTANRTFTRGEVPAMPRGNVLQMRAKSICIHFHKRQVKLFEMVSSRVQNDTICLRVRILWLANVQLWHFFTVFACLVVYVNDVKLIAIVIINPVN